MNRSCNNKTQSNDKHKQKQRVLIVLIVLLCCNWITAFANPIKGKVVDAKGESIIGASIRIKGGDKVGTITDFEGNFNLEVSDNAILNVTYIGYKATMLPVKGLSFLKVVLYEDASILNEVVVVGYSTQKKETLTGSIATVDNKDLIASPMANISNSLVGRVPGIVSNQSSGEPGDNTSTIRIRGASTLNTGGQDPLIVIDGIQSTTQTMNSLDPNEIAGVSVLKDASSTAVYGVKGANGVIIVTTKRGNKGVPKINFSYRYGLSRLTTELKTLNSYDYAVFRNEAINKDMDPGKNQYLFTEDDLWKFKNNRDYTPAEVSNMNLTPDQKEALLNSPALYYGSHDYFHELLGGISPQQQYNINISGGSDRMKYFVSLGTFSQDGVINNSQYKGIDVNSHYKRYNFRSNIDVDVFKNLKLSVDFGGQVEGKQGIVGTDLDNSSYGRHKTLMVMVYATAPFNGPGMIDGKLIDRFSPNNNPLAGKGSSGLSPTSALYWNPVLQTSSSNLSSTFKLQHTMDYLTKGLSLNGTISYNDVYLKSVVTSRMPQIYTVTRNPSNPSEILFFGGSDQPTVISEKPYLNNKWNRLYMEAKLNYTRSFGKHNVTGLLLYNVQTTNDPGLEYNVPASLIGTAARVTYGYNDRYLAEFNMGYNGSENFPEGKRFGFFPAVSLGWIVSNESFFPKDSWISWLKLRGSYGEVGNDQIGKRRFLYLPSTWYNGNSSIGGGYSFGNTNGSSTDPYYTGVSEGIVGNPNVTWERARKSNFGLDWYFFKDRLTMTFDYFTEKRDNILWDLGTAPAIVGAALAPANLGKVNNQGFEVSLGWNDNSKDFRYSVGINLSFADNKIEFMDEPAFPYEWMNTTGFALGQYKGYRTDGFYNNEGEASNRPYVSNDGNNVRAGDVRYVDIDGDGVIDNKDMTPIGYSNMPKFSFGTNIKLEYKGFSISTLFTGSYKGSIPMTSFYLQNPFYMTNNNALQFQYDGRWTPEKVEQGIMPTFPRASLRTHDSQNGVMSDLWLQSTQFVRLKNLEIAYDITNLRSLKKIGLSNVRLFVNGSNLFTWGAKVIDGFDPEQLDAGGASDGFLYPPTQSYNFGVNVQF